MIPCVCGGTKVMEQVQQYLHLEYFHWISVRCGQAFKRIALALWTTFHFTLGQYSYLALFKRFLFDPHIATSERKSSAHSLVLLAKDTGRNWIRTQWPWPRTRLRAKKERNASLSVTGRLNTQHIYSWRFAEVVSDCRPIGLMFFFSNWLIKNVVIGIYGRCWCVGVLVCWQWAKAELNSTKTKTHHVFPHHRTCWRYVCCCCCCFSSAVNCDVTERPGCFHTAAWTRRQWRNTCEQVFEGTLCWTWLCGVGFDQWWRWNVSDQVFNFSLWNKCCPFSNFQIDR